MNNSYRSIYAAFDPYPSPKGSATHIRHFSRALFEHTEGGIIYSLGKVDEASYHTENGVRHERFNLPVPNYLARAEAYSRRLRQIVAAHSNLQIAHFRDIWSALPLLETSRDCAKVFEVNGLPSVELPYRYANLPDATLQKIFELEQHCLREADHIVVPSATIRTHLKKRLIPEEKITLIPNGADIPPAYPKPADAPKQYLIYFGALQPWQGVDVALKALRYLQDFEDLKLVICAAHRRHFVKPYRKLAEKLGVADRIVWKFRLPQEELWAYVQHAELSLAPLKEGPRNLVQGCCPLKILESLACGTTVLASDLPVVRELLSDQQDGRLVKPERPAELARAIRLLLDHPDVNTKLARVGLEKVAEQYLWSAQRKKLSLLYQSFTDNQATHVQKFAQSLSDLS